MSAVKTGMSQYSALIQGFNKFAENSKQSTMQGFIDLFKSNIEYFLTNVSTQHELKNISTLPFKSISNIYLHLISFPKTSKTMEEMTSQMIKLGKDLIENFDNAKKNVAKHFEQILNSGTVSSPARHGIRPLASSLLRPPVILRLIQRSQGFHPRNTTELRRIPDVSRAFVSGHQLLSHPRLPDRNQTRRSRFRDRSSGGNH